MPVAAESKPGQVTVRAGSTIAVSAIRYGDVRSIFSEVFLSITAAYLVTSLPVPAVVGRAITLTPLFGILSTPL